MSSWENWASSWEGEGPDDVWHDWDDIIAGEDRDWEAITAHDAGEELFNIVLSLKMQGKVSAKSACLLAFFCTKAGACGDIKRLSRPPDKKSGSYSEQFDNVVGFGLDSQNWYKVPIGQKQKYDSSRTFEEIEIVPIHDALVEEYHDYADELESDIDIALANGDLQQVFLDMFSKANEVNAVPVKYHPVNIYIDGVAYTRQDSVIGFWAQFALSPRKHLVAVLKKSEMCGCGCHGWDSVYPILSAIAWSIENMRYGTYPQRRHNGQ